MWRTPKSALCLISLTRSTCGYLSASQCGLAPEGVARITEIPFSYSLSMIRSIHPKSNSPSLGSSLAQEKIPRDTVLIRACLKRSISVSRICGMESHCSGL